MSTTDWQQPAGGLPQGGGGPPRASGWPTWVKLAVVLTFLAALGWVLLISAQYCSTGRPVTDLPAVPQPLAEVFKKQGAEYVASVYGVQRPLGVAVGNDGRIYVTESGGESKIHVFNSAGQEISSFAPTDSDIPSHVPVYVAISPGGQVYVSDRDAATIYIFSADGSFQGRVDSPLPEGEAWHPLGLAFDAEGNLYVTEVTPDEHRVLVLDPEGKLKLAFGKQGSAEGEFWFPNGVAVDTEGRIYVSDSNNGRVQLFDKDGNFIDQIGRGMGKGDLSMPRGIAIDKAGRLLVVDTSGQDVKVYNTSEKPPNKPIRFLYAFRAAATAESSFNFPNGLALDSDGKAYVTDRENNRVTIWRY